MGSSAPGDPSPETLLGYYRQMLLIRRFEERAGEMYTRAKIGGYCHLNLGEEATVVGLMAALRAARLPLHQLPRARLRAGPRHRAGPRSWPSCSARRPASRGGRGGSMHLFDVKARFLGGYAIVGGQLPLATGAAWRSPTAAVDEVVMCQMGDATTNIGAFHESLNLAALWKLPVVFVIINNQLRHGHDRSSGPRRSPTCTSAACAYRMAGERVDGNDVLAVRDAARAAVERRREPSAADAAGGRQLPHARPLGGRPGPLPVARGDRAAAASATRSRRSAAS